MSVEVRKRLICYLSGRVQVHVVFVFVQSVYCIVCNLLCEQKKKKKKNDKQLMFGYSTNHVLTPSNENYQETTIDFRRLRSNRYDT